MLGEFLTIYACYDDALKIFLYNFLNIIQFSVPKHQILFDIFGENYRPIIFIKEVIILNQLQFMASTYQRTF